MLTPQEVSDKTFKQAFVGGYDMPAVDEFLEHLTEDYTNLYKENAVLKSKMKVLVEKLEEYRTNEDSIRQAYLAIRSQAEKELDEARAEKEQILGSVQEQARKFTGNLEELIAREEKRLAVTREQTASFVNILKECYHRQIEQLDIIMTASMEDSPQKKHDDAVRSTADEIDASISSMPSEYDEQTPPGVESAVNAVFSELNEANALAQTRVPPQVEAPVQAKPVQVQPVQPPSADNADARGQVLWDTDEPTKAIAKSSPEPIAAGASDEDLIYSIQQSLTATFNVNEDVDWTPEEISEVRRPNFDFSSLPGNFGHQGEGKKDKKRGKH